MLSYLRKKMKTIMIIVAGLFAATMFYGLGYKGIKGNDEGIKKGSIATINGKEIDPKKFQQTMNKMFSQVKGRINPDDAMLFQTMALEQTIDFILMLNDAKRNVRVHRGEVNGAIDQIVQANKIPNMNALKQALSNMGQTLPEFKQSIKEEILISKMVSKIKSRVNISPDDLREVKASHILIIPRGTGEKEGFEARVKAEEILQKIKNGDSFSLLAIQYSNDPKSAKNGGDLGYFTTGMFVPDFEKAAFALKPGEVSDVIKSPYGYHIIKVDDTRLRKVLEKGKDISAQVLAEKQEYAVKIWVIELRRKAKIEINEPLIKAHSSFIAGNLNEAISDYNQAILNNPSNPYTHLFLGNTYLQAGNKDIALLEYEKASQFSGADPNLLIAVGDAYAKIKMKSKALDEYRRASIIAGDNKDVHTELKSIFKKLGASSDASNEQSEISRIEKKEKFEKEIQGKSQ